MYHRPYDASRLRSASDGMITAFPVWPGRSGPKIRYCQVPAGNARYGSRAVAESPAGLFLTGCAAQRDFWCTCNLIPLSTQPSSFFLPFSTCLLPLSSHRLQLSIHSKFRLLRISLLGISPRTAPQTHLASYALALPPSSSFR